MAEALLHCDKLTDSIEHLTLNSRLETDNTLMLDVVNQRGAKWYPKDTNSAKAITFYNMSVAHAIRGEIDMAYRNFNIVRTKIIIKLNKEHGNPLTCLDDSLFIPSLDQ